MNAIQNFAFEEHLVRVVERDGAPWFIGKDVCGALGVNKHRDALSTLDPDERASSTTDPLGLGGPQEMTIVSEAGVYRLVFRSRKPEAERFKRWLAHEVLPQIRKTGRYVPGGSEPEPLPGLDTSSVAVWRAKIDLVREARIQFGPARARLLWQEMGLPAVPQLAADTEPEACLAHLLDAEIESATVGDMLRAAMRGDSEAAAGLLAFGVRAGDGVFNVANAHPFILRLYRPTRWRQPFRHLRRLDGAMDAKVMKYGRVVSRGVELPAFYADEDMVQ